MKALTPSGVDDFFGSSSMLMAPEPPDPDPDPGPDPEPGDEPK
ncbi:MAG: hypothetical protein R6X09_10425 [Bacteroidales bacterium]